jgi:cysteinyl-tRNA synthetase
VRELLAKYPGEVIRLVLLSTHYRQPLDFTDATLQSAKATLDRWYRALKRTAEFANNGSIEEHPTDVLKILSYDLDTSTAIGYIHYIVSRINNIDVETNVDNKLIFDSLLEKLKVNGVVEKSPREYIADYRNLLLSSANILGLLQQDPEVWFKMQGGLSNAQIEADIKAEIEAEIETLIEERNSAKQVKNFAEADRIRQQLLEQNIILEDKPGGKTEWRRG